MRLNLARLLGLLLVLGGAGGLYWLVGSNEFELDEQAMVTNELRYADRQLVEDTLSPWLARPANAFRLPAADMEQALASLPAVARAEVEVRLPARLRVSLVERVPVFVWRTGGSDFLVDVAGVLLRAVASHEPLPSDLPLVDDARPREEPPAAGDELAAVDLRAILKLGAVNPALLGSSAEWLALSVDQQDGYVLSAEPGGWRAIFGHYTPSLRPPDIIERQVQCLRSLLATDEAELETIYLAPADERCGTYVARSTPEPRSGPGSGPGSEPGEGRDDGD